MLRLTGNVGELLQVTEQRLIRYGCTEREAYALARITGVWLRNCRTSASRSSSVLAKSITPEVKRSMRCTTKARCLLRFSSAESRDHAEGVSEPFTGTAGSPA